jgi:feruloyl esterase
MKLDNFLQQSLFISAVSAFDCSPAGFKSILPANTSVTFAYSLPGNSSFKVPTHDIGFPQSPTGLHALCAVEILVPAPGNTNSSLGLFLPEKWNGRFL